MSNLQRGTAVCLSVVSVRGVHPTGGTSAMLHNPGSTNK